MNGLAACMMNVLIGCMKALSACTKACMNMLQLGWRESYGSAAMARSSAVRDAKYLDIYYTEKWCQLHD